MFTFFSINFHFLIGLLILKPTKRSLQILLYILKVSYLTDYKSSFKSHKQFKTNIINWNFANSIFLRLKILSQARRSRTAEGGDVISEIEASNAMYTLIHVKNCFNKIILAKQKGTVHRWVPQVIFIMSEGLFHPFGSQAESNQNIGTHRNPYDE